MCASVADGSDDVTYLEIISDDYHAILGRMTLAGAAASVAVLLLWQAQADGVILCHETKPTAMFLVSLAVSAMNVLDARLARGLPVVFGCLTSGYSVPSLDDILLHFYTRPTWDSQSSRYPLEAWRLRRVMGSSGGLDGLGVWT